VGSVTPTSDLLLSVVCIGRVIFGTTINIEGALSLQIRVSIGNCEAVQVDRRISHALGVQEKFRKALSGGGRYTEIRNHELSFVLM